MRRRHVRPQRTDVDEWKHDTPVVPIKQAMVIHMSLSDSTCAVPCRYRDGMRSFPRLDAAVSASERDRQCLWTRRSNGLKSLRRRVGDGSLIEVRPGLFVRSAYWDALGHRERIMHVLRTVTSKHPHWVLGGISAAAVWGLNETYIMHEHVHVMIDGHARTRDRGIYRFHHAANVTGEMRDGVLVTSLIRTVFDCIRTLPFPEALAICDAAMRDHRLDPDELRRFIDDHPGYKGVRRARMVLSYADPRSENGGESIARAWFIVWGFAVPLLQHELRDPMTGRSRRVDYLWRLDDGRFVVGELDGREKYANPAMLGGGDAIDAVLAEKERESGIQLAYPRAVFVRFSFRQLMEQPGIVRRKLDAAGVPRVSDGFDEDMMRWL